MTDTPTPDPFAVGDIPPHVAAGELIESSWGNGVIDAIAKDRARRPVVYQVEHNPGAGGATGLVTINLGQFLHLATVSGLAHITYHQAVFQDSATNQQFATFLTSTGANYSIAQPVTAYSTVAAPPNQWWATGPGMSLFVPITAGAQPPLSVTSGPGAGVHWLTVILLTVEEFAP